MITRIKRTAAGKKLLSLLLALVMVLGMLPVTAFAEDTTIDIGVTGAELETITGSTYGVVPVYLAKVADGTSSAEITLPENYYVKTSGSASKPIYIKEDLSSEEWWSNVKLWFAIEMGYLSVEELIANEGPTVFEDWFGSDDDETILSENGLDSIDDAWISSMILRTSVGTTNGYSVSLSGSPQDGYLAKSQFDAIFSGSNISYEPTATCYCLFEICNDSSLTALSKKSAEAKAVVLVQVGGEPSGGGSSDYEIQIGADSVTSSYYSKDESSHTIGEYSVQKTFVLRFAAESDVKIKNTSGKAMNKSSGRYNVSGASIESPTFEKNKEWLITE